MQSKILKKKSLMWYFAFSYCWFIINIYKFSNVFYTFNDLRESNFVHLLINSYSNS